MSKDPRESEGSIGYDEILQLLRVAGESLFKAIEPVANAISKALPGIVQMQPYIEAFARAEVAIG
jgi:hypothetical protein